MDYEINLKHLSQRLDYEVATDAGDMRIFLCLFERLCATGAYYHSPREWSEIVSSERFTKGNLMGLVECQIFPKETPVRVYFMGGISWAFFPRNVFVLGRQMLQGEDCWRDWAATKIEEELLWVCCSLIMGVGGSLCIGDLDNLAVSRSSVAMASSGLRCAVCMEKHGRDFQERV